MARYIRKIEENYPLAWTESLADRPDMVECDKDGKVVTSDYVETVEAPAVLEETKDDAPPPIEPPSQGVDPQTLLGDALAAHLNGMNDKLLVEQYAKDRWGCDLDRRNKLEKMVSECVRLSLAESD